MVTISADTVSYCAARDKQPCFDLVENYHYSGRAVKHSQVIAAAYLDSVPNPIAAIFFAQPVAKWSEPVLELVRLVRDPQYQQVVLTKLVSCGVKQAKQDGFDLLLSYADSSQDHHGGVYQASSWNYHGIMGTNAVEAYVIDGEYVHRRTCNARYGTSSSSKIRAVLPDATITDVRSTGKHLYWKALNKSGTQKAFRLGLRTLKYYKPLI